MIWLTWVSIGLIIYAALGCLTIALGVYLDGEMKEEKDFEIYFWVMTFSPVLFPIFLGVILGRKLRERGARKPPPFDI